ncbi:S8/S53 family peptidase [Allosphingosinicella deserti]|nr:S8/S53 family peptidase [Sphingomonas deserti]
MDDDCTIFVRNQEDGVVPASGVVVIADDTDGVQFTQAEQGGAGELYYSSDEFGQPEGVIVTPQVPGYWVTHAEDACDGSTVICPEIDRPGEAGWWHRLLEDHAVDPQRGAGIRIGIVDSGFAPQAGLEHVRFLSRPGERHDEQPRGPFWRHGEVVCRVIGDRAAPACCAPIAPGADLLFASASFTRRTLRHKRFLFPAALEPCELDLDPTHVADAVSRMVLEERVHLINLSLGTFDELPDETGLAEAIELAWSEGVLVVCAAGNEPYDRAAFPAVRDDCVGVGAIGRRGWGPPEGLGRFSEALSEEDGEVHGEAIFYSPLSAYGDGVDVVGPGVSILVAREGRPAFDVTGTSFAAPIVTGLLAVDLAGDEAYLAMPADARRAAHARQRLADLCIRTGVDEEWEGHGLPWLCDTRP